MLSNANIIWKWKWRDSRCIVQECYERRRTFEFLCHEHGRTDADLAKQSKKCVYMFLFPFTEIHVRSC